MTGTAPRTSLDGFHASETANRADRLGRRLFDAVNAADDEALGDVLAPHFLAYERDGVLTRAGMKSWLAGLRGSFSDLRMDVHENVGVLVEDDLIALRTVITGTHDGVFADVAPTGRPIQTSATNIFRFAADQLTEHWLVVDWYRVLVGIGRIDGVAVLFQRLLGEPEAPEGIFVEKPGTDFDAPRRGRPTTREESRAMTRLAYDGVINTGRADTAGPMAENYLQNTGWTPDGREHFVNGWVVGRAAMPGGRAMQTHIVAERDRTASISVWDGTVTQTGRPADFLTGDFLRIEDDELAEHWDTVEYTRLYHALGLLPEIVSPRTTPSTGAGASG